MNQIEDYVNFNPLEGQSEPVMKTNDGNTDNFQTNMILANLNFIMNMMMTNDNPIWNPPQTTRSSKGLKSNTHFNVRKSDEESKEFSELLKKMQSSVKALENEFKKVESENLHQD